MLGVVLVDLGLVLCLVGLVGMVRPARRLGLPTRRRALLVFAAGLAFGLAGALLPARERSVAAAASRLDEVIPVWQFEERHEISVKLQSDDLADQFPPIAALQLFRLVQEALTNVRKHAAVHEATVTLRSGGAGQLEVVIADDGQGFVPLPETNANARSLGLTSMRERVESIGGAFEVQSQPGSGTRVTAIVPMPRVKQESGHVALATPPG